MHLAAVRLLVVAGLLLSASEVYAQREKKWNPYSGEWETVPPGAVLRYNPKTFRYGYEAPSAPKWDATRDSLDSLSGRPSGEQSDERYESPGSTQRWDATREALESIYRRPSEEPSDITIPSVPQKPKAPAWQGFPPGAEYNEKTKRFEYRR